MHTAHVHALYEAEGAHINTESECLRRAATARAARGILEDYVSENARTREKCHPDDIRRHLDG
jgi:hypothetical protein